jgi:tetratricopeptide (TPR) repeat protein
LLITAVGLDSLDTDVGSMLDRVNAARRQRLSAMIGEVRSFGRTGLVAEAESALQEVRSMGAPADTLAALRSNLDALRRQKDYEAERQRQERNRQAEIASLTGEAQVKTDIVDRNKDNPTVSAARRRELDQLEDRARGLYEAGNVDEAVRVWELVWSEEPGNPATRDALRQEYLSRGMESFSAGRLEEAVGSWENALRVDPEDRRTRSYLDRGRQQLARIRSLQQQSQSSSE